MNLENQCVVITGASGNLGTAVARAFVNLGANVVLVDRSSEHLEHAGFTDDAQHLISVTDLLDQAQVNAMVLVAGAKFGGIDVLCNIAGGFRMGEAVCETSDANWNFPFDINARTLLHAARAVVPHMLKQEGGKIIRVGAIGAQKGGAHIGASAASKASVMRLTESMSAELRKKRDQRQRRASEHHRHPTKSQRHAQCRPLEMGLTRGAG